ncbi:MAG: bacterioferritin [Candidatus Calescibacterium sp.]|nr:bacterioferritin [Candidatus Calescibacterium sp.]MCX7733591.1 bacterioferritin [bacterium]
MKGNPKIIEMLNDLLSDELTAIVQYIVQAELFDNWGYKKLHKIFMNRAKTEMQHAEKHIERIIFLEGKVTGIKFKEMEIGENPEEILKISKDGEEYAVKAYNNAIKICEELGDNGTKTMLESILKDEESHLDLVESQLDQIKQMGLQNFLSTQTEE